MSHAGADTATETRRTPLDGWAPRGEDVANLECEIVRQAGFQEKPITVRFGCLLFIRTQAAASQHDDASAYIAQESC